jgi:hypothetical protein
MSDIQSKLAAGVREAKKQQDEPQAGKAEAGKPKSGDTRPPKAPARSKAPAADGVDDANQVPCNTGDDPWADLHPQRVWPD